MKNVDNRVWNSLVNDANNEKLIFINYYYFFY